MKINRNFLSESGKIYAYAAVILFVVCVVMVLFVRTRVKKLHESAFVPPAAGISGSPLPGNAEVQQAAGQTGVYPPAGRARVAHLAASMPAAELRGGNEYGAAATPPRGVDEMLEELASNKRKPGGVPMSDKQLEQKIYSPSLDKRPVAVKLDRALPLFKESDKNGQALVFVPVEAERIATENAYAEFARRHKGKALPRPDFGAQMLIVLVSKENGMPSKIFEIVDIKADEKTVFVKYRVNPFESRKGGEDSFAHSVVKKSSKRIVLEQVL
ncbi:MAG: hypothetical protein PHW69_10005 [Elusimicrobiaceae bacterium]|nr:hypothetical protein [Elusimicrobiaceae bacterium]